MRCKAGEFLNQTLGICVPCAPGEYSLGNAIRYEFNAEARKRYQQQVKTSNPDENEQNLDVWKSITLSEFTRIGSPDSEMPRDSRELQKYNEKKSKCAKYY